MQDSWPHFLQHWGMTQDIGHFCPYQSPMGTLRKEKQRGLGKGTPIFMEATQAVKAAMAWKHDWIPGHHMQMSNGGGRWGSTSAHGEKWSYQSPQNEL